MANDEHKINLSWARQNIPSFKKYEAAAFRVKADEARYRRQPGYEPVVDLQVVQS